MRARLLLFLLLLSPGLASAQGPPPTPPALPRAWITVAGVPACGTDVVLQSGADVQAALNTAAAFSDALTHCLTFDAGATFPGAFILPARGAGASGWVLLRSSGFASLPPQGTRVQPSDAVTMATFIPPPNPGNYQHVFAAADRAHHYWFVGVEITVNGLLPTGISNNALVDIEPATINTDTTLVPHHVIFDRIYIHSSSNDTIANHYTRGILINSTNIAIVDSYCAGFRSLDIESQCIAGWSAPGGPFKIVNNYIESASQNILIGGAAQPSAAFLPTDFEIRLNTINKRPEWNPADPSYAGFHWQVKQAIEFKTGQRILLEANTYQNNWAGGQAGYVSQFCGGAGEEGPWNQVSDVTVRHNLIGPSTAGMGGCGHRDAAPFTQSARLAITNNLFTALGSYPADSGDLGWNWNFGNQMTDLSVTHNTALTVDPTTGARFMALTGDPAILNNDGGPWARVLWQDNIGLAGGYGVFGSEASIGNVEGQAALNAFAPGGQWTWSHNVLVGPWPTAQGFQASQQAGTGTCGGSCTPSAYAAVSFVNQSACGILTPLNCTLTTSSAYHQQASDGTDIGVNLTTLQAAFALGNNAYPLLTPAPLTLVPAGTGSGTLTGSGTYAPGTVVTIAASPAVGSTFTGWSGLAPCPQTAATPTTLVMPSIALTCTGTFAVPPPTFLLSLTPAGSGNGTTTGGGSYAAGTVVPVSATPDGGSTFTAWGGGGACPTGATTPTTVTMPAGNLACTATFAGAPPTQVVLTLAVSGPGNGTVTGGGTYLASASATLTATAASGSAFSGWSGPSPCPSGTTTPTTITLGSTNLTCTATFSVVAPVTFLLTVTPGGTGNGSVTGGGTYAAGTVVALTATPAAGSTFTTWGGPSPCPSSATSPATVVMPNADLACTATFAGAPPTQVPVTLLTQGSGTGTVTGGGTYLAGGSAVLTAVAAAGSSFTGWSGGAPCPSGTTSPATITLGSVPVTCTATFTTTPPTTVLLTLTAAGTGSGVTSGGGLYPAGTVVIISAEPSGTSAFTGWSGGGACPSGTTTPTTLVMPASPVTCTATFAAQPLPPSGTSGPVLTDQNCPGIPTAAFPRSLGDVVLTVTNVASSPTVPAGALFATINVQVAPVRVRADGGPVTATTGQSWGPNTHLLACGGGLGNLRFIRDQRASKNATVYISFYGP